MPTLKALSIFIIVILSILSSCVNIPSSTRHISIVNIDSIQSVTIHLGPHWVKSAQTIIHSRVGIRDEQSFREKSNYVHCTISDVDFFYALDKVFSKNYFGSTVLEDSHFKIEGICDWTMKNGTVKSIVIEDSPICSFQSRSFYSNPMLKFLGNQADQYCF